MKYKFNKELFKKWFDLNDLTRNRVISTLGQRDSNKVGRWILGQTIGTEDLIALCNNFNLEINDFLQPIPEAKDDCIETLLPEEIKLRRNQQNGANLLEMASTTLKADDITIARLSLQYEQKINQIEKQHSLDMKEMRASTRRQMENREKFVSTLQDTISILNKNLEQQQNKEKALLDTINTLKQTIASQQENISSYDAIIRGQKKIPSQPIIPTYGSTTMVNDGGGAISTTQPSND